MNASTLQRVRKPVRGTPGVSSPSKMHATSRTSQCANSKQPDVAQLCGIVVDPVPGRPQRQHVPLVRGPAGKRGDRPGAGPFLGGYLFFSPLPAFGGACRVPGRPFQQTLGNRLVQGGGNRADAVRRRRGPHRERDVPVCGRGADGGPECVFFSLAIWGDRRDRASRKNSPRETGGWGW